MGLCQQFPGVLTVQQEIVHLLFPPLETWEMELFLLWTEIYPVLHTGNY